jgi:hypothetical protein
MDERKTWFDDATQLESTITTLRQEHAASRNLDKTLLRLYYQRPVSATNDPTRPYAEISTYETIQQLGFGLTREVVDASCAQTCIPLRANVEARGGDFKTDKLCKDLGRLVDGIVDATEFGTAIAPRCYKDGEITTAGWVEWFVNEQTGEIDCNRKNPLNVYSHYDEGDEPANLYTVDAVPRHVLKARFPEKAAEISQLPAYKVPSIVGVTSPGARGGDSVRVNTARRIRLGNTNGKYTITSGDLVLSESDWAYDFHTLVPFIWDDDHEGIGGVSLARVIAPYHVWSNLLVRTVYDSLMGAVPSVLAHVDSLVDQFSDLPFQKQFWDGPYKPEIYTPNPVSPQVLEQIDRLRDRAHAEGGVNIHAAQGTRPQGLNSAPAQREWVDIGSIRGRQQQRTWERAHRLSAKAIVGLASSAYRNKAMAMRAPGTNELLEIKFPKDLKESQYQITFPLSSGLSQTVSGRLEQSETLKNLGVIDVRDVARNVAGVVPDIERLADRANAPRDLAEQMVDRALSDGVFTMPSAIQGDQGLDELIKIASEEYQRAQMSNRYPPENVEQLRRLIRAAQARRPKPAPPAPPPPQKPIPVEVVGPGAAPAMPPGPPAESAPAPVAA